MPGTAQDGRWTFVTAGSEKETSLCLEQERPFPSIAVYRLTNIHAANASNTIAKIHSDELLIPVFFAMRES